MKYENIPNEIITEILYFCDVDDLWNFSLSSKRNRQLVQNEPIMKSLVEQVFPHIDLSNKGVKVDSYLPFKHKSYKDLYNFLFKEWIRPFDNQTLEGDDFKSSYEPKSRLHFGRFFRNVTIKKKKKKVKKWSPKNGAVKYFKTYIEGGRLKYTSLVYNFPPFIDSKSKLEIFFDFQTGFLNPSFSRKNGSEIINSFEKNFEVECNSRHLHFPTKVKKGLNEDDFDMTIDFLKMYRDHYKTQKFNGLLCLASLSNKIRVCWLGGAGKQIILDLHKIVK